MQDFKPQSLISIRDELKSRFPFPIDYALMDDSFATERLEELRKDGSPLSDLTLSDFNYIYQISTVCTKEEYASLKKIFPARVTANAFYIGWAYCQIHADNKRPIALFVSACEWMSQNKKKDYEKTLIGKFGLPWDDLFLRASDTIRKEKTTVDKFCNRYDLIPDTPFIQRLHLAYITRCDKEELKNYEEVFAGLITVSKAEFLKPAMKNYAAKVEFEEMSPLISEAISNRLSGESDDESFGLSQSMLQLIRQKRFTSMLEELTNKNTQKVQLYGAIAGKIKGLHPLNNGFFAINFGNYIVVDSPSWFNDAYAYDPKIYNQLLETWTLKGFPDEYWPAMDAEGIADAHDQILGIVKAGVIKLSFLTFDILYTKDLLTITRY